MGVTASGISIIKNSIRDSSMRQYTVYLKRFFTFCFHNHISLCQVTNVHIVNFLQELFASGLGYSALNTARSSISTLFDMIGKPKIGEDKLVCRFMKGVFQLKPSLPRYINTWDPSIVLDYMRSIGDNLQLLPLSMKCVTLLALCSSQRLSTIHGITVDDISITHERCCIRFTKLSKQSRIGYHLNECVLDTFDDPLVCPVRCITLYLEKTRPLRLSDGESKNLFLTTNQPHKVASKDTLSRWVKNVLKVSGLDPKFKPHSIRSATSSDLFFKGIPVDDILNKVGWSSHKTFATFYKRPLLQKSLSSVVLQR